jgi:hypothetical protein
MNIPKFTLAVDCDDVLVNTAGKWVKQILLNDKIIKHIPDASIKHALSSHPMNRVEFKISSHFNPEKENNDWLNPELESLMFNVFFKDPKFYDDLKPSNYVRALEYLSVIDSVESINIITSCMDISHPVTASKIRFLDRIFKDIKKKTTVRYFLTEKGETKSSVLNNHNIEYTTFVDDHLDNIIDVISNTNSKEKEFLIPRYRYNLNFPMNREKILLHQPNILWFDNDMHLSENNENLVDKLYNHSDFKKMNLNWN